MLKSVYIESKINQIKQSKKKFFFIRTFKNSNFKGVALANNEANEIVEFSSRSYLVFQLLDLGLGHCVFDLELWSKVETVVVRSLAAWLLRLPLPPPPLGPRPPPPPTGWTEAAKLVPPGEIQI